MNNPNQFQSGLCLVLASLCVTASMQSAFSQTHPPPPRPAVAPLIGKRYANDADGDRIDDALLASAQQAKAKPGELVDVELIFNAPVTQRQIDTFTALGGEITYLYKAVSYGWNGRIPLNKISAVPAAMGASLVLLHEPRSGHTQMDLATRTGRVRPIWSPGFAGSATGFSGNSNTTIAILDTGVDESHTDLNGRRVFWQDYTASAYPNPIDVLGHGTHVAGIALGSGAAAGSGSGILKLTQAHSLSGWANGGFQADPMELPTNQVTITVTAKWNGGGGTTLYWAQRLRTWAPDQWASAGSVSGTSPLTLSGTLTALADHVYSPALIQNGNITDYVVTIQLGNYPGVGDGFNKLRGVAAGCNWAGAKVASDTGSVDNADLGAAIDDLVANRVARKIKVMNLSIGGALDAALRQKVNSAAMNGILMAVGAGNRGVNYNGIGTDQVTDAGRAAMALTVGAANSLNQLTDYTREGFTSPSAAPGQEEDYKPDLMAPGGSVYQAYITAPDTGSTDGAFGDVQPNDYKEDHGCSMATPFAAGAAALVIDAMEKSGVVWDFNSSQHARFVKMVLCATASESNVNREGNTNNPTLQRATSITNGLEILPPGKDLHEGYGMLNPDAAVEAVALTYTNATIANVTFGSTPTDRRVWARTVSLFAGRNLKVALTSPATGDFDLYLYGAIPSAYGTPVLLASSTQAGNGVNELLNYVPACDQSALLVVKRVSGSGTFDLLGNLAPAVDFTTDVTSGVAPLTVNFTDLTTGASSNLWQFGDGNTSANKSASNTYANAGSYTVTLIAVGPGGTNSLTKTAYILVSNPPPPVVDFVGAPTSGLRPLTVYFTNLTTGAGSTVWNFGDGQSSSDKDPNHTYTNAGSYTVTLSAIGPGGTNTLTRLDYILALPEPVLLSPTLRGNEMTFSFETITGKYYSIQYKDELTSSAWTQFPQVFTGDGSIKMFTNSISAASQRFFRLRISDSATAAP